MLSFSGRLDRSGRHRRTLPEHAGGIDLLAALCLAHQVDLVAMEATGGYERQAFARQAGHGLPVAILNPRAVRQFAQSMGRLEKTDAIDAGMIAWFAAVHGSQPSAVSPPAQQQLRALVTRLRQLTDLRTAQKNQQRLIADLVVQATFTELLAVLHRQICALADTIERSRRFSLSWQASGVRSERLPKKRDGGWGTVSLHRSSYLS